jgi:predicted SAM-dependent methyltransferase
VQLLEYFDGTGAFHQEPWETDEGMIHRSRQFDERNADGEPRYTSIILDARKP